MTLLTPSEVAERWQCSAKTVKRFVLDQLREASKPLTSRDITEAWIKDRGLWPDEATFVILRKRVGACLKTCEKQGLVIGAGQSSDEAPAGPLKLWKISS